MLFADGDGPEHFGVCSNYLKDLQPGDTVECFVRNTSSFHLPEDTTSPIILVGPGTGIAPFRGFWQHRSLLKASERGNITLYFGCRTRALDLYADEKKKMLEDGVLTDVHLALSREPGVPKTYVQDQLVENGREIVRILEEERGHFYVCGDCTMADHVYQKLKTIFLKHSCRSEQEVENFMLQLRDESRYHEDIFGITLRTEEVHKKKGVPGVSRPGGSNGSCATKEVLKSKVLHLGSETDSLRMKTSDQNGFQLSNKSKTTTIRKYGSVETSQGVHVKETLTHPLLEDVTESSYSSLKSEGDPKTMCRSYAQSDTCRSGSQRSAELCDKLRCFTDGIKQKACSSNARAMSASPQLVRSKVKHQQDTGTTKDSVHSSLLSLNSQSSGWESRGETEQKVPRATPSLGFSQDLWRKVEGRASEFFASFNKKKEQ
ncbi:Oxidoreductase FAD/NAD(P)-binding [Trinorchestia longiramus]|nr:Oxidoreductase FAD/NAD(P)-binding [Trinorchestia longiramus]